MVRPCVVRVFVELAANFAILLELPVVNTVATNLID